MNVAILLLNKGRGSGGVAKEHAEYLLNGGHRIYFIHPAVSDGVSGAQNIDVNLSNKILPVHEYLPAAKDNQKAVSAMSYAEAMSYLTYYENALESVINDVDIVTGHHANLTAIATHSVCSKHNKPYVLFLHGTGIEPRHHGLYDDKIWSLIEKSIKNANGLIVTTEYVRDNLIRNIVDVPNDKFLIQACGVKMDVFNPNNIGNIRDKYNLPEKYVICPGALTKMKGPQNVVEASKYYSDIAETIFIGDGDIRSDLETSIGDRGRIIGFVSDEDKAQLINSATILTAAPDKLEHFGIIYTEAMAAGVPIVAYEGGGVNSIVTEDEGILTDRDPKSLGLAIKQLLIDKKMRNEMSINCRQRAQELYSTEVLEPKILNWLETKIQ